MEKNSTTIILVCAMILIIGASIFTFSKFIGSEKDGKTETKKQETQQTIIETTKTDKVEILNTSKGDQNLKNKTSEDSVSKDYAEELIRTVIFIRAIILIIMLASLASLVLIIISYWKIYSDNNQPGWASIIPIYNQMVLYRIVGYSEMYALFILIPMVGSFITLIINIFALFTLGQQYQRGILFSLGLILLPMIFLPILAFGKNNFKKRAYDAFYDEY